MPFDVNRSDSDYVHTGRASQISLTSNSSDQNYEGIDQIEFFLKTKAYLQRRIDQDTRGSRAQEVDQKYDEALFGQVQFIDNLLQENIHGPNVVKGKSADQLEHCVKSLMPIIRVSDTKFLFGTTIRPVQLNSEKLMVLVGGGAIKMNQHWRTVAVSETIKLNKLIKTQKLSMSNVVKLLLEKSGAGAQTVSDFMVEANTLDDLFNESSFLLRAWSKQQSKEQLARNTAAKKKKSVSPHKAATTSHLEYSNRQLGASASQG